eukprot:9538762-Ditylum_brightwellii.AAC.2
MSPDNVICIDKSDDNNAGSPQPSVVASAPVQCSQEGMAGMMTDKTADKKKAAKSETLDKKKAAKNITADKEKAAK